MSELKPCPFCGERDDLELQTSTEDREGTPCNISCGNCGACGPWVYVHSSDSEMAQKYWARIAWDERRAADTTIRIEKLYHAPSLRLGKTNSNKKAIEAAFWCQQERIKQLEAQLKDAEDTLRCYTGIVSVSWTSDEYPKEIENEADKYFARHVPISKYN